MNKLNSYTGNVTMGKLSLGKANMEKLNTVFYKLFAIITLTTISFSASANRPSMEEETANIAQQKALQEQQRQVEQAAQKVIQQPAQTTGDVLVLPPKEMQPGETINIKKIDIPRHGISMDAVRRQLGEPIAVSASVGQPPITHWTYKDRIVYFEYSTVLHVVAR